LIFKDVPVTKSDCRGFRRNDDIDPQWLADYAEKNPGVYLFGNAEDIDRLRRDLGSTEWQRMLSVWREHKQQECRDNELLASALKDFHDACTDLNLVPHEVLRVLTAHLEVTGGELVAREVEAMHKVYSRVYGTHGGRQSCIPAPSVKKTAEQIDE
jgi:hypothetical protein